ncbi:MAG: MFS transporter [Myxococcales bacterium]|nr:MFS transporter [Myxococcales bacterium]
MADQRLALRALYLILFGFLGGQGNYLPLWLDAEGWTDGEIGWLGAVRSACLIFAPMFWGRLSDLDGHTGRVLRVTAIGSAIGFLPTLVTSDFWIVMSSTAVFHFFREGIVPAADTAAIVHTRRHGGTFGGHRIWGSIGFIIGGFLLAIAVDAAGRSVIPAVLMALLLLTLLGTQRVAVTSDGPPNTDVAPASVLTGDVVRLMVVILLWRIASAGIFQFLPLHLGRLGVPDHLVPAYWAAGVISEMLLFVYAERLFGRWSAKAVFLLCLGAAALQSGLGIIVENPWIFLGVMTLHGLSFGVAFYTTVVWLGVLVPRERLASVQAVLYAVGFGVGGALSSAASGYLYEHGQGPWLFGASTIVCVIAILVGAVGLRERTTFGDAARGRGGAN